MAGCDRQSAEPAQPPSQSEAGGAEAGAAAAGELAGTLDRGFAGEMMPDATVTDPDGAVLALSDTRGKPVLLNLWATWCAPCVVEMPLLDELAGELGDSVTVLTVSEDMKGAEVVAPFFAANGYDNLPQWLDPQNDLAFAYGGGPALPLTVMYDAQGKEVWRVMGGYHWDSAEARELVAEALPRGG